MREPNPEEDQIYTWNPASLAPQLAGHKEKPEQQQKAGAPAALFEPCDAV
jgi:hypothetical protein